MTGVDVKFDVILGNPPFSDGRSKMGGAGGRGKDMTPKFFAKALELADTVAMVMPNTQWLVKRYHNALIKEHASAVIPVSDAHLKEMGVAQEMWVVITGHEGSADVSFIADETGNSIDWRASAFIQTNYKGSITESESSDSDAVIHFREPKDPSGFVTKYIPTSKLDKLSVKSDYSVIAFPTSGYAVILPRSVTKERGHAGVRIVECGSRLQVASKECKIVFTDTIEQAERLVEVLRKPETIDELWRVRNRQGDDLKVFALRAVNISKEDEDYIING